jgi:hypothetical protein
MASFFFNEILSEESEENEDPFDMLTKGIKVSTVKSVYEVLDHKSS